jgi:hypothetical protein
MSKFRLIVGIILVSSVLAGCSFGLKRQVEWEYIEPETYPVLSAVGYAPINAQNGEDKTIKSINAIKASKLDAYRELAEQVYGQRIDGNNSVSNLILTDSHLKASVEGVIRGAQVVKSYPVGDDTYATEIKLDFKKVYDIYLATARPRKVKKVRVF